MSAPDILAPVSFGWNRDPAGVALGSERTGVSAALWRSETDEVQELTGAPADCHILSVHQTRFSAETFYDGRLAYSVHHSPGMISLVRAHQTPRAVTRGRFGILHLYIAEAFLSRFVEDAGVGTGALELIDPANTRDAALQRIGSEVLTEMHKQQPLSRLRIDALGQDLAIHLLRRWSNLAGTRPLAREPVKGGLSPHHVRRVSDYLEDHLAGDVSLDDLSTLVGLSTFHLCRAFKQSTGLPPHRWRLARRIERAREMLEGTDLPVTEVAAAVGYDDPSQLAAAFRKAIGVSPSQYRRERRY